MKVSSPKIIIDSRLLAVQELFRQRQYAQAAKEIKKNLTEAKTVSGLSNISFGLPKRKLLNQGFLVLALEYGMDAAILDPTDKALMAMVQVTESLVGKDVWCTQYISAFREGRLDF